MIASRTGFRILFDPLGNVDHCDWMCPLGADWPPEQGNEEDND